jgi:hypothetical protein
LYLNVSSEKIFQYWGFFFSFQQLTGAWTHWMQEGVAVPAHGFLPFAPLRPTVLKPYLKKDNERMFKLILTSTNYLVVI